MYGKEITQRKIWRENQIKDKVWPGNCIEEDMRKIYQGNCVRGGYAKGMAHA